MSWGWRSDADAAGGGAGEPARTGSHGPASRGEAGHLTAQHRDFVAQDQDFGILDRGSAGEQPKQAEHRDRDQIQQSKQLGAILP